MVECKIEKAISRPKLLYELLSLFLLLYLLIGQDDKTYQRFYT